MQSGSDLDKRKLLSVASHASILISALIISIAIPFAIMWISDDPVVKENAKEAINFHINVMAIGIMVIPLSFITFGLFGLIWFLLHWGLSIWAIIHSLNDPNTSFRYPFILRLL